MYYKFLEYIYDVFLFIIFSQTSFDQLPDHLQGDIFMPE